ncbi:hypothetical protein FHX37_4322 [Haloactinospora alba]|uniref:Metalloprotease n=1 Tax=Haloactinospora alba TaxID=405555 RepID=A0A543N717_9ACTN|nr:neutral zinc metallopeptidase [Haloactinospora alba]TQN27600.1 hypothetical protein FHX37_4322 [Haloactinospora alba]
MAERKRAATGEEGSARLAHPNLSRRSSPRPRLDIGITVVVLTGLTAVGLAGFVSFSTLFSPEQPLPEPVDRRAGGGSSEGPPPGTGSGSEVLTANPLYTTGQLAEVTCEAPGLDPDDEESMERFLHRVTDCLDEAWREQFSHTEAGFEPPDRIYWYASGKSPCGNYPMRNTAAFYCQANEGLYLGVDDIVENSGESTDPETYTFLLSHEYAHHVQGEAGILDYFHEQRRQESEDTKQERLTRRSELQANCLGGAFLGTVADSYPIGAAERENVLADAQRRGDYDTGERTHGSPENGKLWTAHGMDRRDPAACDTWKAGRDLVD